MEAVGRERGADGDVMPSVGGLREEDAAGSQDAMDLAEDLERAVEMLEDVVAHDDVEALVLVGDRLAESLAPLVEMGIVDDPGIGVDAADPPCESLESHLGDDSGAGAEIEEVLRRVELCEDGVAQQPIVPARLEGGVATPIEPIPDPFIPAQAAASSRVVRARPRIGPSYRSGRRPGFSIERCEAPSKLFERLGGRFVEALVGDEARDEGSGSDVEGGVGGGAVGAEELDRLDAALGREA